MDENLVGYLLKALDAGEQHEVERYLQSHPEADKRLDELGRGLDRLAQDAGDDEPPPWLWVRALARVAEHKCRSLPPVPSVVAHTAPSSRSGWWRRADVLVAALLLLVIGALGAAWIARFREKSDSVVRCKENLRKWYGTLNEYAANHNGDFPRVEAGPPRNFAGSFVPSLTEAGAMKTGLSVICPGDPSRPPSGVTFPKLDELYRTNRDEFDSTIRGLAGCYAYSLGYRDPDRGLVGLTQSMDEHLPLMADIPPSQGGNDVLPGNSPNHNGQGQNVLCVGGQVEFRTNREIDPYLNATGRGTGRVAAGSSPSDAPVARSDAVPLPEAITLPE